MISCAEGNCEKRLKEFLPDFVAKEQLYYPVTMALQ